MRWLELAATPSLGPPRLSERHRAAGAQPDGLCGPYWLSILLAATGAGDVAVEEAAVAAGTLVADVESVPPGEPSRPATDPRLRRTDDPALAGTSVDGMLVAAASLSGGTRRFVPVTGAGGGPFEETSLERLLEVVSEHAALDVAALLNLRTGALVGSRWPLTDALAYLAGEDPPLQPPDWDVGHFVQLAGAIRGSGRTLAVLRDTYPSLGIGGAHLQPLSHLVAALRRGDGYEGGCLLFVAADRAGQLETALRDAGLDIGVWDNGTPNEQGGRT
ncbi:MAG: hypothetical protein KatS3mg013_1381 [Actinomycetota bacterium]|jgi:hypothetical protein|nr:MAG: hypothetical protein KatS3mg013_1381 [Actinomycetota bacterium]